jgi:hypothetical protein
MLSKLKISLRLYAGFGLFVPFVALMTTQDCGRTIFYGKRLI